MLKVKTFDDGSVQVEGNGSAAELTNELLHLIATVHHNVKEGDPDGAKAMRRTLEIFLNPGSETNKALFDHGDDPDRFCKALKKEANKMATELFDKMKKMFDDLMSDGDA